MTERPPQRTPNRQLAALIAEAGFSNAGLARRVDQLGLEHGLDLRYDKTSVTRWLRGQQPRGTTPALIAEVFTRRLGRRLSAQDLGLDACAPVYAGLEFAATPEEAVDIVGGLWRKDSGSHAELRKIAFTPAGLVVPSRDWLIGRADERVGRGDARPGAPPAVPAQGRPVGAPAAAGPRPRPRASGSAAATSRRCAPSASCSAPSTTRTAAATPGRRWCAIWSTRPSRCCAAVYGEQPGRRLFAAAADLTRLAGWTSYDIAAHGLAQRYFVQALRLAQAAGDRAYGAYVLVTMSRQAVYLGHGREAVQLARVAQQGVGSAAPPVVQALLHAAEARGHGVLGEVRACTAALARAERALEAARPGDEVPHWARFFDEAQLADEFGHCHRDLQQYRAAAQHAERSLQLRAPASPAAGSSAGWCSPPRGWASASWSRPASWARRRRSRRRRCARRAPHEYVRDFERRLEPYRDAAPCAATATGWRRSAEAGPGGPGPAPLVGQAARAGSVVRGRSRRSP